MPWLLLACSLITTLTELSQLWRESLNRYSLYLYNTIHNRQHLGRDMPLPQRWHTLLLHNMACCLGHTPILCFPARMIKGLNLQLKNMHGSHTNSSNRPLSIQINLKIWAKSSEKKGVCRYVPLCSLVDHYQCFESEILLTCSAGFSDMLVTTYQSTWHHIQNTAIFSHHCENLKPHILGGVQGTVCEWRWHNEITFTIKQKAPYSNCCPLHYDKVWSGKRLSMFWKNMLPTSSGLPNFFSMCTQIKHCRYTQAKLEMGVSLLSIPECFLLRNLFPLPCDITSSILSHGISLSLNSGTFRNKFLSLHCNSFLLTL
jgi:hypothetical protein